MPTGDHTHVTGALRRLRQHWFAPSRPLAVDDEPHWRPAADPDEASRQEGDLDIAPAPAGQT
jgi:hypothetical protein